MTATRDRVGRHRDAGSGTRWRWLAGAVIAVVAVAGVIVWLARPSSRPPATTLGAPTSTSALAPSATVASTGVGRVSPTGSAPKTRPAPVVRKSASPTDAPTLQVPVPAPPTTAEPSDPTRLIVDKIGVNTSLYPLQLRTDGTLQAPPKWQQAGWYAGGVKPGEVGPAVIAGHVDSQAGRAVFYRLRDLRVGDDIDVVTESAQTLHFTVTRIQRFAKADFPTADVYGPSPLAEVKLITCTGDFNRATRSYVDNLIVTAVLNGPPAD